MPLRTIAEIVSPYAQQVNDFTAAQERVTHRVNGYALGPIICYELIDDGLVRDMAIHSSALIVQTNSATFAGTAEGSQQLAITRIRAIEHNRDILSVSTVGISALLDNNGNVIEQSQENVAAAIAGELPMRSGLTISDRLGGVAPLAILFLSLLLGIRARKDEYVR
jgi:apolipoprotein N-acyltransferase